MNERNIQTRARMAKCCLGKNYSFRSIQQITLLFAPLQESEKEAFAEKILEIVKSTDTETEALEKIMALQQS